MDSIDPAEEQLVEEVAQYAYDPHGFVNWAFPWGEGDLEGQDGPRKWQDEFFVLLREHLQNPETRYQPFLFAGGSGHGIGKSALISQLLGWGLSCWEDCKAVVTANTERQLRTKTWTEVAKWFRRLITRHWFKVTATAVHSTDKAHESTWRADAISWSINNTEAFAGLHNKDRLIILVFDEASAIDDIIWETAEGALTDENTIIVWVVFGNFTRATGRFVDCFKKFRHRWKTVQIDSRDVEGTNKVQIQKWIDDYGIDSDFVKVRVRGIPPNASMKQLIPTADVDAAIGRHLRPEQYNFAPIILTLEPAWTGADELVFGYRQGLHAKILHYLPKNDNDIYIANLLARYEDELKADAVFVDGGYGTGVVSWGRTVGRNWIIVWFGGASSNPGCLNKRAEMWEEMRKWIKEGGTIPPDDKILYGDLIGPETVARVDGKIQLESKEDMKARGLPSPNRGDAIALTFAFPVVKKDRNADVNAAVVQYDPYDPNRR